MSSVNRPRIRLACAGVAAASVGLLTPLLAAVPASASDSDAGDPTKASTLAKTTVSNAELPPAYRSYTVKLAQFNILTSSIRPGGVARATRAARAVQASGAHAATFQEVAADQLWQLMRVMPRFDFYPRRTLGTRGSAIQIAWNTKDLKLMNTGHIMRPFLRWKRPIPWVRLQDRATGRKFFIVAIHNSPGGMETERDISTRAEIRLIKKLLGRQDPIFVQGDVNERSEFCEKVAAATPLVSANGGKQHAPCPVPRFGGPDWMLGHGAEFSGFAKVYNGISDHPMLKVTAEIPALKPPAKVIKPGKKG